LSFVQEFGVLEEAVLAKVGGVRCECLILEVRERDRSEDPTPSIVIDVDSS
jgi:hypothetical protein